MTGACEMRARQALGWIGPDHRPSEQPVRNRRNPKMCCADGALRKTFYCFSFRLDRSPSLAGICGTVAVIVTESLSFIHNIRLPRLLLTIPCILCIRVFEAGARRTTLLRRRNYVLEQRFIIM